MVTVSTVSATSGILKSAPASKPPAIPALLKIRIPVPWVMAMSVLPLPSPISSETEATATRTIFSPFSAVSCSMMKFPVKVCPATARLTSVPITLPYLLSADVVSMATLNVPENSTPGTWVATSASFISAMTPVLFIVMAAEATLTLTKSVVPSPRCSARKEVETVTTDSPPPSSDLYSNTNFVAASSMPRIRILPLVIIARMKNPFSTAGTVTDTPPSKSKTGDAEAVELKIRVTSPLNWISSPKSGPSTVALTTAPAMPLSVKMKAKSAS